MSESTFQTNLMKEIRSMFPGCIVFKVDPTFIQGFPDLMILYKDRWATLECKDHKKAGHRPNQDKRIKQLDDMSFAAFIYPENKEDILDELRKAFQSDR